MAPTIIFDLGGVLVHLNWERVCAPLSRLSDLSHDCVREEVRNGPIVMESMMGYLSPQKFHQTLCAKIHAEIPFDPFIEIWNGLLSPDEEMAQLVGEFSPNHRLVLASNTDAIHFAYCRKNFSFLEDFDSYFLSYEMGLLKPDPAYFHYVLNGLQAKPGDCIFIDDRLENVQSAEKAGMNALVFESIDKLKSDLKTVL